MTAANAACLGVAWRRKADEPAAAEVALCDPGATVGEVSDDQPGPGIIGFRRQGNPQGECRWFQLA